MAMKNESGNYYASRHRFNELLQAGEAGTAEAASLFYYLNRTGYNGLCRFNRRGLFNVPFGRYRKIDYRTDFAGDQAGVLAVRVHPRPISSSSRSSRRFHLRRSAL